jgi:type IV secretion system protein VirB10
VSPSVNAAPAPATPPGTAAGSAAPGIVSVNARGGRSTNHPARAFVYVLIFAVLAVGSLYLLNGYQARQKEQQAQAIAESRANKPAEVGRRRTFSSDPAEAPVPAQKTVPREPTKPTTPIPAIVTTPPPPALAQAPKSASRYGGELIVPPKGALGATTPVIPTEAGKDPAEQYRRILAAYGAGQVADASARPAGLMPTNFAGGGSAPVDGNAAQPGQVAPVQLAQAGAATSVPRPSTPTGYGNEWPVGPPPMSPLDPDANLPSQRGKLDGLLKGSEMPKVRATMLGNRNLILPKGRTIDCSLATRVVSEVSGMAECTVASNVYSDNGRVLLLERGSQASGEYVAAMAVGQRRLFVVWTRIKTPTGVVINLDSPASDALGAAGLPGYIDNRWVDRIGAAVMLSLVQDAIAYAAAHDARGGGYAYGAPQWGFDNTRQTGDRMVNTILQQTIAIKPTLYKNQGDRASIYIARDLDFESVYALRNR